MDRAREKSFSVHLFSKTFSCGPGAERWTPGPASFSPRPYRGCHGNADWLQWPERGCHGNADWLPGGGWALRDLQAEQGAGILTASSVQKIPEALPSCPAPDAAVLPASSDPRCEDVQRSSRAARFLLEEVGDLPRRCPAWLLHTLRANPVLAVAVPVVSGASAPQLPSETS